jgi:hypothetical protein
METRAAKRMPLPDPAVADANWLEPHDLYFSAGATVERDRPIYQGDVFANVPVPVFPESPPTAGRMELEVVRGPVMVVPHPCQCYHGDRLRPYLTLAPVTVVSSYGEFGHDRTGAKDKFALPDLPYRTEAGDWSAVTSVADFGRLFSAPSEWLFSAERLACLSHMGLGLLAKRVLSFQLRYTLDLTTAMTFTAAEWNEAFLMQAWTRSHRSLVGYSKWMRSPTVITGVGQVGELVKPYEVRASALDALLELITGQETIEPA